MRQPLEGIKVLELSKTLPGSFCTQVLADYGCEVIKIEDRGGDDARKALPLIGEQSARYYSVNRNKKSLTLDLRKQQGKEIIMRFAERVDIIVDGFRPGVMEKLGLGYDELKKMNDRLIYCALTGFGSTGPARRLPAHDINILSLAGITSLTGTSEGKPGMFPIQMSGLAGGSLYGVIAIIMALFDRQKTGQGQFCDVSMMDGSISLLVYALAEWSGWGRLPQRGRELNTGGYAYYQVYETSDHRFVSLGASEAKFWNEFCERIGLPQYIPVHKDPEIQEEMIAEISAIIRKKSQAEWLETFADTDICLTAVNNIEEMSREPQVTARDMIIRKNNFKGSGKDMVFTGLPFKLSASPGRADLTFSEPGEHSLELLLELGYQREEIESLRATGVI